MAADECHQLVVEILLERGKENRQNTGAKGVKRELFRDVKTVISKQRIKEDSNYGEDCIVCVCNDKR